MRWSERLRKIRSKRIPPRGEERRAATRLEPRAAGPIGSPALRIVGGPRDAGRPSRGYRPDGCSVAGEGVPLAAGAGLTVPEAGAELPAAGAALGLLAAGGGLELLENGL